MRSSRSISIHRRIRPTRSVLAGAIALAAFATPLAISQIATATNAGPLPNQTSPSYDEIQFNQDTSQNGTYLSFVPGANSQAPVNSGSWSESANNGGGCSPGITYKHSGQSADALLNISAKSYTGGSATIGDFKYRTGVCLSNAGGDQAIDTGQALDFSLSPTPSSPINTAVIGSGRTFADARIWVARADKNTDLAVVTLTEWLKDPSGTEQQVGSQVFMVGQGAPVTLDSSCPASVVTDSAQTFSFDNSCTGGTPTNGFDQVEVRNSSTSADSVTIVGGASFAPVFYLQNELCVGGKPLQGSSGTDAFGATATITLLGVPPGSSPCKSYSQFVVGGDTQTLGDKFVEFDAAPLAGSHFTVHVDWGDASYCTPDGENGVMACPPTDLNINGTPTPQTYCPAAGFPNVVTGMTVSGTGIPANTTVKALSSTGLALTLSNAASPGGTGTLTFTNGSTTTSVVNVTTTTGSTTATVPLMCTTSKQFSYPSVSGTTYTDIVENWDGLTDWRLQW